MGGSPECARSYVVTLVHGTFARHTGWIGPSSMLRQHLQERLPGDVRFETFSWSGANAQQERVKAGAQLKEQLSAQLRSAPDALHYVISHSHGGNVSIYAMADGTLDGRLAGIACLNTPFICATPRSIGGVLWLSYLMSVTVTVVACVLGLGLLLAVGLLHWQQYSATGKVDGPFGHWLYVLLVSFMLTAGVAAGVLLRSRDRILAWLKRRQAALIATLQLPVVQRTRVISLWTSSDEVYGAFSMLEGLSTVPYALLHPIFVAISFVIALATFLCLHLLSPWNPLGWGTLGANPIALLLYHANDDTQAVLGAIDSIRQYVLGWEPLFERSSYAGAPLLAGIVALLQAFFVTFFLSLLAIVLAVACNTMMRLLPMGVGGYRFLDSLFVRLSFTLVPVTVRHSRFIDVTSEQGMLKHTIIYNDPLLLEQLVGAIRESAAQPAWS